MLYRVFLDTNVYDGSAYSFRNATFKKMMEFGAKNELILVTNSVIDGEVRSHINTNISNAVKVLNEALDDRYFAFFRKIPEYEAIVMRHNKQEWVYACLREYDALLQACRAEHISISHVDMEKIMSDYFQKKPPFETKKPEEFKDAIAVASVIMDINQVFANSNPDSAQDEITYCVVSNDKGFRNAVLANCDPTYREHLRVFDELKKFIDYTSMMDRQARFLKAFLMSEFGLAEMNETVCEAVKNASLDIYLDSGAYIDEQDCIDVQDVVYTPYILGIYEEDGQPLSAKVLLDARCSVKVWYRYTDEDNSYYDKEDHAYLWKKEVEKEDTYEISLDVVISLDINDCVVPNGWYAESPDFDFSEYVIEFNDYLDFPSRIALSEDNLIGEELLSENDPFLEYEDEGEMQIERAYSTCSDCGSPISRLNDGGNGYCSSCALNY